MSRHRHQKRTHLTRRIRNLLRILLNFTKRTSSSINKSLHIKRNNTSTTRCIRRLNKTMKTTRHTRSTIKTKLRQRIRLIRSVQHFNRNYGRVVNRNNQIQQDRTRAFRAISNTTNTRRLTRDMSVTGAVARQIRILTRGHGLLNAVNRALTGLVGGIAKTTILFLTSHNKRGARHTNIVTTRKGHRPQTSTKNTNNKGLTQRLPRLFDSLSLHLTNHAVLVRRLKRVFSILNARRHKGP